MTNLMEVLEEQASFAFTGKVNILKLATNQFLGIIFIDAGRVVGAQFGAIAGKRALFKMIFQDVESVNDYRYVAEPEIISESLVSLNLSFEEVKVEAQRIYQRYVEAKKLRPPMNLRLVIDPEIIVNDVELSSDEFDTLGTLAEWCKVEDVYKYSKLMDYEVTNALVSLRKKRAIKVFQN